MTHITRKITSTAAAVLLAAGIVAGLATPAQAYDFPPVTPIAPGPGVPMLPPGYQPKFAVSFPSCASMLPVVQRFNSSYRLLTPAPRTVGTDYATPQAVLATASPIQTCMFGLGTRTTIVTEAAINASQYATIDPWYTSHAIWWWGGGLEAGTSYDRFAQVSAPFTGNPVGRIYEGAVVSSDGWWITLRDSGTGYGPSLVSDLTTQFLTVNWTRR